MACSAACLNPRSDMPLHLSDPAELTVQVLDVFDIAEGELGLIAGGEAVRWVHDSSGVR